MNCDICGETVVDDQYGKCKICAKPFHLYGRQPGLPGKCGEETLDGDLCQKCLEERRG